MSRTFTPLTERLYDMKTTVIDDSLETRLAAQEARIAELAGVGGPTPQISTGDRLGVWVDLRA